MEAALKEWSRGHDQPPPCTPDNTWQRAWDKPRVQATSNVLLETAPDPRARARLLATATTESGAWLHALPITSLGLRMDDEVVRVAVGLRLGVPLCQPHLCSRCGAPVDELATHGLSCSKSQGRHPRHAAINELIQRSLVTAGIPAQLEPTGVCRSDGKRPDGSTVMPWRCGRALAWDATCPDTYAPSHLRLATSEAGAVAEQAEMRKSVKYADLQASHHFVPVAIETSGVFGQEALSFIRELGRRLRVKTGEPQSHFYLQQRVAVAVQRGNTAAVMGTCMRTDKANKMADNINSLS